jgi:hypothetical protein
VSQLSRTHVDLVDATKTTKVSPPSFPKWDGNINSVANFLACIDTFKKHKYFNNITDWTKSNPFVEEESLHIRTGMFDKLTEAELSTFINDSCYDTDGIAILDMLLTKLNPTDPTNQLNVLNASPTLPSLRPCQGRISS